MDNMTNDNLGNEIKVCCFCGRPVNGIGNNPYPVITYYGAVCCDRCNETKIIPERMKKLSVRYE